VSIEVGLQYLNADVICPETLATSSVVSTPPFPQLTGRAGAVPGLQPVPAQVELVIGAPVSEPFTVTVRKPLDSIALLSEVNAAI
jgi:hypothetical protein